MKRQTRRTVSFRAQVYERARRHASARDIPLAAWVEEVVTRALNEAHAPEIGRDEALVCIGADVRPRELEGARSDAFDR